MCYIYKHPARSVLRMCNLTKMGRKRESAIVLCCSLLILSYIYVCWAILRPDVARGYAHTSIMYTDAWLFGSGPWPVPFWSNNTSQYVPASSILISFKSHICSCSNALEAALKSYIRHNTPLSQVLMTGKQSFIWKLIGRSPLPGNNLNITVSYSKV